MRQKIVLFLHEMTQYMYSFAVRVNTSMNLTVTFVPFEVNYPLHLKGRNRSRPNRTYRGTGCLRRSQFTVHSLHSSPFSFSGGCSFTLV